MANRRDPLILAALLAGCAVPPRPAAPAPVPPPGPAASNWAGLASSADRARLAALDMAWRDGLSAARGAGHARAIAAEGRLLDPAAGLDRPAPTPGSYHCRTVRLGKVGSRGTAAFARYGSFYCYIDLDGDRFTFVKQTGSERPAGRLYEDGDARSLVFLGAASRDGERRMRAYGDDPRRDLAGRLERIGPFRWRLAMPRPAGGAAIDVLELTPVADQPE